MDHPKDKKHSNAVETFSHRFAGWAGTTMGFFVGLLSLVVWLIAGRFYDYSTRWEDTFNIYLEAIAFLMIFLMQRAQNKGLAALQVKLNELIASSRHANNKLINAEELSESEIKDLRETHRHLTDVKPED